MTANTNDVLEHRVSHLEKAFEQTNAALKGIDESLRTLAALEAHHAQTKNDVARTFDALRDQENRLRALEKDMPNIRLVTKHIIAGVIAIVGAVAIAAGKVIFSGT